MNELLVMALSIAAGLSAVLAASYVNLRRYRRLPRPVPTSQQVLAQLASQAPLADGVAEYYAGVLEADTAWMLARHSRPARAVLAYVRFTAKKRASDAVGWNREKLAALVRLQENVMRRCPAGL